MANDGAMNNRLPQIVLSKSAPPFLSLREWPRYAILGFARRLWLSSYEATPQRHIA